MLTFGITRELDTDRQDYKMIIILDRNPRQVSRVTAE